MGKRKTNQLKMNSSEKKVITILAIATVFSVLVCGLLFYMNDFYEATQTADEAMFGNQEIEVVEKGSYYVFRSKTENSSTEEAVQESDSDNQKCQEIGKKGIIFYPGGKVEETAYAPILLELAENGYEVYLVKMPMKLAVFGMNRAETIMEEATHITKWTMMGHSLGGAMAASFSAEHDEQVDKLVLLAAYSTEDLTNKEIEVYSFYGTEDNVLNMEKYKEYYNNLPEDVVEEVIEGGNHSGYAYYGEQDKDGEASISKEEQQECVLDVLLQYAL